MYHNGLRCRVPVTDMGVPEDVRKLAARLYKKHNFNAAEAGKELTSMLEGEGPSEPGRFCKRWWAHFEEQKTVKDKPRKGRPRKVPADLAAEIARKIVGNPCASGVPTYYYNLRHFLQRHEEVAQRVRALGLSMRTLWRAVLWAQPSIVRRKPGRKKLLNPEQKEGRRVVAAQMLRQPAYERRTTVFVDEATLELRKEGSPTVICVRGVELPPDQQEHAASKAAWRPHYIGGVMEGVGSVGFYKLTVRFVILQIS